MGRPGVGSKQVISPTIVTTWWNPLAAQFTTRLHRGSDGWFIASGRCGREEVL